MTHPTLSHFQHHSGKNVLKKGKEIVNIKFPHLFVNTIFFFPIRLGFSSPDHLGPFFSYTEFRFDNNIDLVIIPCFTLLGSQRAKDYYN